MEPCRLGSQPGRNLRASKMQRNFFERQRPLTSEGGTESGPKPGDFPVGSLESRAAARARLEGEKQPKIRMTLLTIGKPFQLVNSTCTRTSWPNGTLFEFVEFNGSEPTEAQQ